MELTVVHLDPSRDAMECVTPAGVTMRFDNPDTGNSGASPMEHLLAALGACALVDVGIVLRKKRLTFRDLRVMCVGDRREGAYPRVFTGVKLRFEVGGPVPKTAFDEAVKLSVEKYCSAAGTVREGAAVSFDAVVVD